MAGSPVHGKRGGTEVANAGDRRMGSRQEAEGEDEGARSRQPHVLGYLRQTTADTKRHEAMGYVRNDRSSHTRSSHTQTLEP